MHPPRIAAAKSLSRRAALAGLATVATAPAVAGRYERWRAHHQANGPDAALLALADRFDPLFAEWQHLRQTAPTPYGICSDEEHDRLVGALYPLAIEILSHRASTRDGLALQARAIMSYVPEFWDDAIENLDGNETAACHFIRSVCAFTGVPFPPIDPDDLPPCGATRIERVDITDVVALGACPGGAAPPDGRFFDPAKLPQRYAMRCDGDCMEPDYHNGDVLIFDRTAKASPGDCVVAWRRPECTPAGQWPAIVKRLVWAPDWVRLPYTPGPHANVQLNIVLEYINPTATRITVRCSEVLAIHRCLGAAPAFRKRHKPTARLAAGGAR